LDWLGLILGLNNKYTCITQIVGLRICFLFNDFLMVYKNTAFHWIARYLQATDVGVRYF